VEKAQPVGPICLTPGGGKGQVKSFKTGQAGSKLWRVWLFVGFEEDRQVAGKSGVKRKRGGGGGKPLQGGIGRWEISWKWKEVGIESPVGRQKKSTGEEGSQGVFGWETQV